MKTVSEVPELMKLWSDENILDPETISTKSHKKAFWICSNSHEWAAIIKNVDSGNRCSICSGKKVWTGVTDIRTKAKWMIDFWDFDKNEIDPSQVTTQSNIKRWWRCKLNHSWEASPNKIFNGRRCPYCSNHKILIGFNDVATTAPRIVDFWDLDKNKKLTPFNITKGSPQKAFFLCPNNHSFQKSIVEFCSDMRCVKCNRKTPLRKKTKKVPEKLNNNLYQTHKDLIINFWDLDKNELTPEYYRENSSKKVWWKCELGHSYDQVIQNKTQRNCRCPYCSNHRVLKGFNDLATTHSDFLKIWDYDKNKGIADPENLSFASEKRVWWKCELNHSWDADISKVVANNRGCPYCSKYPKKILSGFNDLATKNPEVLEYWDYSKNIIDPTKIAPHSEKQVWWKCELSHEWESAITKLSGGNRCPYCAGKRVLIAFNDLLTFCPNIMDVWLDEEHPSFYHKGSEKSVSVLCPESGETFQSSIHRITAIYPYCPCYNCISGVSKFEKEVNQFIKSLGFETTANNRSIISPKELDIVIESKKIAIECNGDYWHSDEVLIRRNGMSAKEFHQLKKDLAKDAGYDLFFVWENDWKDRKDLIQSELNNILNNNYENINLLNRLE